MCSTPFMPNKLSTHVLDTAAGCPAAGVRVKLFRADELLADVRTNAGGRCEAPLLEGDAMLPGAYRLCFHIGDYFVGRGVPSPFLDMVQVDFKMMAGESYHVPLVCSPWSYSTYRGS
jgi:5-hydroxyisourate hydrolase